MAVEERAASASRDRLRDHASRRPGAASWPAGRVDCRYQYPSDSGTGYATSGLSSYIVPAYDQARIIVPTATMVNRLVITIPFHFHRTVRHSWWWHGNVDWDASATGSPTLTRYKRCHFTPRSPIGASCPP